MPSDTNPQNETPQSAELDADQLDQVAGGLKTSPAPKSPPPVTLGRSGDPCEGGQ